jgi:hypothetical protein
MNRTVFSGYRTRRVIINADRQMRQKAATGTRPDYGTGVCIDT